MKNIVAGVLTFPHIVITHIKILQFFLWYITRLHQEVHTSFTSYVSNDAPLLSWQSKSAVTTHILSRTGAKYFTYSLETRIIEYFLVTITWINIDSCRIVCHTIVDVYRGDSILQVKIHRVRVTAVMFYGITLHPCININSNSTLMY